MILTGDNYHTPEANQLYMSNSQYGDFLKCESYAMAKISGEWKDDNEDALLIGSYVHAWNEGTLDKFMINNPDMFTKKGELYAKYKLADKMIATMQNDDKVKLFLNGKKEVIFTAEFCGVSWRIMIDIYRPSDGLFGDLKTTRNIFELSWSDELGRKVSFIEKYNYLRQFALYSEIEKLATGREDWLKSYMVAVSKQVQPDKAIIDMFDRERFGDELQKIRDNMPRIIAVKYGGEPAGRCEMCDYCRSTKKIKRVLHYSELEGGF
jgi:hypothetical protein